MAVGRRGYLGGIVDQQSVVFGLRRVAVVGFLVEGEQDVYRITLTVGAIRTKSNLIEGVSTLDLGRWLRVGKHMKSAPQGGLGEQLSG